ncbi:MAG: hypothetical protein IJS95_09310 [Prevotella sp.]|nr:hypothetical protein [Prevotella sp.]
MMKRLVLMITCVWIALTVSAQEKKFSPEKFQADMEAYISNEANLTAEQSQKLFPLLREMHGKQRTIMGKVHQMRKNKPADDAVCADYIKQYDKMQIELKTIEQNYHKKMMAVIPASKLFDVIKAENRFHRQMMKGWQQKHKQH